MFCQWCLNGGPLWYHRKEFMLNLDIKELRDILSYELKNINCYELADKVDLLEDNEVKDILLNVFIANYKKGEK